MPKVKVTGQRSKSCLSNNSKTTEANFTKLHGKIKHNEKVCRAQELSSYAQGQGHNQFKIVSQQQLKNYLSKFKEISWKDRTL